MIPLDKHIYKKKEWVQLFVFDTTIREPYVQHDYSNMNDRVDSKSSSVRFNGNQNTNRNSTTTNRMHHNHDYYR